MKTKGVIMRKSLIIAMVLAFGCFSAPGQTADELIGKYFKTIGGVEKLSAIKSIRMTGKLAGGGGCEAGVISEAKRPNMLRQEFIIQGFTAISAYDGKQGWKINPFGGKKDAEALGEDELKSIIEESDIDGPLFDFTKKGNKVVYVGKEDYEGSDVYKLQVTLANGTIKTYFLDTDYYVPIKVETKQFIRGAEVESESVFGDYKEVGGVYFPHSVESGPKGSSQRSTITYTKIEINPAIDDARFAMPKTGPAPRTN
jgi:outer membrane lipoprotein-sorting protein